MVEVGWEEGKKSAMRMREIEPPGALCFHVISISTPGVIQREFSTSYLSKNTHLHVVWLFIAPPRIGPRTLATTNTVDTIAIYFPNSFSGTMVGAMAMIME